MEKLDWENPGILEQHEVVRLMNDRFGQKSNPLTSVAIGWREWQIILEALGNLRDELAAKALPAVMAEWAKNGLDTWEGGDKTRISEVAYAFADAMIEARKK